MTGRGFGKRNDENTQSNYGMENEIGGKKRIKKTIIASLNFVISQNKT